MTKREIPSLVWLWIPALLVLSIPIARLVDPDFHERWFNQKEGPIEWLTVAVLVPAVWAGVAAWRRRHLLPNQRLSIWIVVLTLGSFYIAAEEISWGQTVFGWASPELFEEYNGQQETNIHNASSWFNEKPRFIFELFVLFGGIYLPWKWRRQRPVQSDWRAWFWPTFVCLPTAVLAILVRLPDRFEKWVSKFETPFLDSLRLSEPQEFYFAYFLMVFLLSMNARLATLEREDVVEAAHGA